MTGTRRLRICALGAANVQAVQARSECFARLGHEVRILSPDPLPGSRIEVMAPSSGHATRPRRLLSYLQMAWLLLRWRPDVVVVHYAAAPFNWLLPLLWFRPLVVSVMGGDILFEERRNWSPGRQRATLGLLAVADCIVSMSGHMLARYPDLAARALVSPWGIDLALFAPGPPQPGRRESLGIPAGAPVVLSPRRPVPVCGILNVVEAMALAAARIPDAVLLLLGDKPNRDYERQIFERIDALGLRDRIVWLNGVDRSDMPEIYRLANVTVSVATSDGVSLSVLESMAVKTPVVLGDIPNYNGIFEHRKHCLMVDPTAPDRIADGIVDALTDDALRASLTEEAHRKVERDGNLDTEASRIEQMLLHLAGRRGRRLYLGSRVRHVARLVRLGLERRTRR